MSIPLSRLQPSVTESKLYLMIRRSCLMWFLAATVVMTSAVTESLVQIGSNANSQQEAVPITDLFKPVYPRLAIQGRVRGDVELKLFIRQDGTVESAEAISGPPFLIQAAVDSAKKSKFDCSSCTETLTSYRLVYSFKFGPDLVCASRGGADEYVKLPGYPQITQTNNHVVVIDQPIGELCNGDVILTQRKVRSIKCLYLWKCGFR